MRLQTPSFWYPKDQSQSVLSTALLPAAWVYETISQTLQNYKTTRKVSVPVLCIGNLVAGGTGKTPAAIAVLTLIKDAGLAQNPFFLTRGYGGASRGPLIVQDNHGYTDVGDEALLLARHAPCVIAADRYAGAQLAVQNGADFIIMDDGLQNPGLYKDFKLI
ncbi:MAG: tetraacyldisaccharide 4'-kinase, partial [Bdellovibrionales bacterium]